MLNLSTMKKQKKKSKNCTNITRYCNGEIELEFNYEVPEWVQNKDLVLKRKII